jgi:hypothetical protein
MHVRSLPLDLRPVTEDAEPVQIPPEENDGVKLFRELSRRQTQEGVVSLFGNVEGP